MRAFESERVMADGKMKGRFARMGLAVAALAVLVGIGVALAASVGTIEEAKNGDALMVEEPQAPAPAPKAEDDGGEEAPLATRPKPEVDTSGREIATPSTTGPLHVEGSQLVDEAGNPVQLRGVSTHGLAWYPQFVNQQMFNDLHDVWGANAVRLAVYSADSGGWATDGGRVAMNNFVIEAARMAEAADLFVIVDWHILSDGNPLTYQWAAEEFFKEVSVVLKDQTNVIYEICNEPNGSTTWDNVKDYAEDVIPWIRRNDPDAVVIVGTPTWSQDLEAPLESPLDIDNVMYALHFYAATHQDDLRNRLRSAVEAGLPVFVSEFGICEASGDGAIDYESADAWVAVMDSLNVSYICWNLSNKDEAAALIKPDVTATSGFTLDDLTPEGLWLADILKGPGFDRKELMLARAEKKPNAQGSAMMAFVDGTIQWQLNVTETWEEDGRTFFKYEMTGSNYSAGVKKWSATIPFNRDVQLEDSWNCVASASGNELTVANDEHNGKVAAGDVVEGVGFIVSGPADLAVVDL